MSDSGEPESEEFEQRCPKCKVGQVIHGFGLAGGGYGPYTYCSDSECEWFEKVYLPDDAE